MSSLAPDVLSPLSPSDTASAAACFHCGLPVPEGARYSIRWDGAARPLCCAGCEAVAQAILNAGLADYYRLRTNTAPSPGDLVPDALRQVTVYDHPKVQRSFVRAVGNRREATLILEGITCAACIWLNEQHLQRLPGVLEARVNYATRRAQVVWDDARLRLSGILAAIQAIGYRALPYDPARSQQLLAAERRTLLKRLGLAGIMGAQTMTLSVALYVGDWSGSDLGLRTFFHWISLLLTLPVLFYSAQPFFRAAWNDLRRRRLGMDVPIALGMAGAFGASVWTTVTGVGTVYYDSVAMFVFFLLGARYFELVARARTTDSAERLIQATPAIATRMRPHALLEQVPVAELERGDVVLVRPGETVPADGVVAEGRSSVNEAVLTGESLPLPKTVGSGVIGGSINVESPLTVRVEKVGADSVLSAILRLLDRAQTEKPRIARLADRAAAWFVAAVLALTALVALYWWQHDPARALPIVIAVLVVTCPCALGLATPTALTAATGALTRIGLLITRGHALETLARATYFVFDKTGTLTRGELRLARIEPLADLSAAACVACAAALERHSEHPIARAIAAAAGESTLEARDVRNTAGEGLLGTIGAERYFLGTPDFIERCTGRTADRAVLAELQAQGGTVALLASRDRLLAALILEDTLRPGARRLIAGLRQAGNEVALLSGDQPPAAQAVAAALGIGEVRAQQKPDDKLAYVRKLQAEGAVVAMVGDGVNDAPVLAAAQVSVAMGNGASLSAASADAILLAPDLGRLGEGIGTAKRTLRVIRQNLAWAAGYNLLALPAAAAGFVTPWMAALGMSLSSALVVANALRLTRSAQEEKTKPQINADERR